MRVMLSWTHSEAVGQRALQLLRTKEIILDMILKKSIFNYQEIDFIIKNLFNGDNQI